MGEEGPTCLNWMEIVELMMARQSTSQYFSSRQVLYDPASRLGTLSIIIHSAQREIKWEYRHRIKGGLRLAEVYEMQMELNPK